MAWLNVVLHTLYFLLLVSNLLYQTRVISIRVGRVVSPIPGQTSHWSWKKELKKESHTRLMITIVVVVIVIVLTYGSIWRQKELGLTKQTLWQTGEPDLHPVSARQGAKKIMQWFALEMQHNAQNAVYCTIDAHYATQVTNKMHEIIAHIYNEIKCLTGIKKCNALHSHWQQIGIR